MYTPMVLFDGIATQSGTEVVFHGGAEYAKFILNAALKRNYVFDVVLGNWLNTDDSVLTLLNEHREIGVYRVNNKKEVYDLIERNRYKVFYSALPSQFYDYSGKALLIGVIHGLRGAELPWDFYRYQYEPRFLPYCISWGISHFPPFQRYLKRKHIEEKRRLLKMQNAQYITVSNHSKNSLYYFYPELIGKNIDVFYSPFSVKEIGEKTQKENYFLMVSANRFEKNVYRSVKVFDGLFSRGYLSEMRVVITGCGKQPFWKELKNRNRFELLPYVSAEKLEELYARAFCFIYPSLNEGFGYPPLKAMAYGTPVIASSATSIPEVCDNAACYFSPVNEDDLAIRILQVQNDYQYRKLLVSRGLKRVEDLLSRQETEIVRVLNMIFERAD